MMAYYFMKCMSGGDNLRQLPQLPAIDGLRAGAFNRGNKIEVPVPSPIDIDLMPESKGNMPEFFHLPTFIMKQEFADALIHCGVDNIDYYPARIHDRKTGESWNYLLGNVIGVVDVIDVAASTVSPLSPPNTAMLFDEIVLDESRVYGLLLFRPKHKKSSILVSDVIKNYLESLKTFRYVRFIEPQDKF
jgi:hypothetical protein